MTSTYCDLLFVKWAVNSGGIMLRHPVLWQFVSAPFPTKAVVKSHHMISRGELVMLAFLPAESVLGAATEFGGSSRGSGIKTIELCDSAI